RLSWTVKKNLIFIFLIFNFCATARAESLYKAVLSVKQDIKQETAVLNDIRQQISQERLGLSNKIKTLENEVVALRKKKRVLEDSILQKETGFDRLKAEAGFLREEVAFSSCLVSEYRRDMSRRMSMAEEQRYSAQLEDIDQMLVEQSGPDSLVVIKPLLELTNKRNSANLGGSVFQGDCLDKAGRLYQGSFVLAGPAAWFVSKDADLAGLAGLRSGSIRPAVTAEADPALVQRLAKNEETSVLLDFTLGEALKVKSLNKSWLAHIKAGGIIMFPILSLGVICLIIGVWKFLSLLRLKTDIGPVLSEIIRLVNADKPDRARTKANSLGYPAGPVLLEGIEHCKASREHMEEIMHEQILSQLPFLERHLPVLAVSAAAAPLLGLLGTVTGMMHTFNLVTLFGTGKTSLLSGGISEALITTEYGLIIAVPALLMHAYLSRRVKTVIHTLEQTAVVFINGLKIRKAQNG
ncbi:MAG: MotA/TolQ/ExbB proton channel family protein, partial [Candidatus Omnitrophica bacterium]|nr:MotA/TolQ/ExbB proton channel family protein [Candidatus Omnitrophota bacterium]